MNYPHIVSKVYRQPWAILPERHIAIQRVLESKLAGEPVSDSLVDETQTVEPETENQTAIIPIYGIIGKHLSMIETICGGCDLDLVNKWLDDAANDNSIDKIILDIRSPGGVVTGVPETAKKISILAANKDLVAFSDSEMCSAAYWLASQAEAIYVSGSSAIGSIGVYMALLEQSRALEMDGLKINTMSAGKWKLAGAPWKPLTDEERAMFQAEVDKTYEEFKSAVKSGRRGLNDEFMEGQVFNGEDAVKNGLADGLVDEMDDVLVILKSSSLR